MRDCSSLRRPKSPCPCSLYTIRRLFFKFAQSPPWLGSPATRFPVNRGWGDLPEQAGHHLGNLHSRTHCRPSKALVGHAAASLTWSAQVRLETSPIWLGPNLGKKKTKFFKLLNGSLSTKKVRIILPVRPASIAICSAWFRDLRSSE